MMKRPVRDVAEDPVIARYLRDVDRSLLRRNLGLTPQQRLEQLQQLARLAEELRKAGGRLRRTRGA